MPQKLCGQTIWIVCALFLTNSTQAQALEDSVARLTSDKSLNVLQRYDMSNIKSIDDSSLRVLLEPQDFYENTSSGCSRIDKLENEALQVFISRIKNKSAIVIERQYGQPFLKVGDKLGFTGVTSSQCLWLYYFGRYKHYPVGVIFNSSGHCQHAQILTIGELDSLHHSKLRLLAQAKGKTKSEIYELDPYPQSISKSLKDVSRTVLRYYCHSSSYFDLIFKDEVCVESDSNTLTVSERFSRRETEQ